jgi:hypothetical protein
MITIFVISCNFIIVIVNLCLIIKIYKIKKNLANIADIFIDLETNVNLFLKEYSLVILKTALEFNSFNNKYKLLKKRNQQLKQLLVILSLSYRILRQKFT